MLSGAHRHTAEQHSEHANLKVATFALPGTAAIKLQIEIVSFVLWKPCLAHFQGSQRKLIVTVFSMAVLALGAFHTAL